MLAGGGKGREGKGSEVKCEDGWKRGEREGFLLDSFAVRKRGLCGVGNEDVVRKIWKRRGWKSRGKKQAY